MLDKLASGDVGEIADRFNAQHLTTYGYRLEGRTIQIVNLRVTALGTMPAVSWPRHAARPRASAVETRRVLLPNAEERAIPVFRFVDLGPGQRIAGPTIVEYPGSTLFVPPDWDIEFDEMMNAHVFHGSAPASAATAQEASR